ncbi:MAG: hypothetical protein ACQEXV_15025 [Bacillota bacterium]
MKTSLIPFHSLSLALRSDLQKSRVSFFGFHQGLLLKEAANPFTAAINALPFIALHLIVRL